MLIVVVLTEKNHEVDHLGSSALSSGSSGLTRRINERNVRHRQCIGIHGGCTPTMIPAVRKLTVCLGNKVLV